MGSDLNSEVIPIRLRPLHAAKGEENVFRRDDFFTAHVLLAME